MTLDDLRVLVAACELRNLSAVARRLSCTQPAVAQHIKRLEAELGQPLFERHPRGVVPTPAGRVLFAAAAESLVGLDAACRHLEEMRRGEAGPLRVITGGTTIRHFMADAIAAFRQNHPGSTLDLRTAYSTSACVEALRKDTADLAFVTLNPSLEGIDQRRAVAMPWKLIVPRKDELARAASITLRRLRRIRYIALPATSASRHQLEAHLAEDGVTLVETAIAGDWDTAILLVELGLGHAIVPAIHADHLADRGTLTSVGVTGLAPIVFGWAARRWSSLSPLALDFAASVNANIARWNVSREA
jgi:DNA-binding transcriptional LysR family regulator